MIDAFGVERDGLAKADKKTKALMGGVLGGAGVSVAGSATQVSRALRVRAAARAGAYPLGVAPDALRRATRGPRRVSRAGLGVSVASAGGLAALGHHRSKPVSKSAFEDELAKAAGYQRGTITQHQEQARLHSRKKTSGRRQAATGASLATAGLALHANRAKAVQTVGDALVHSGAAKRIPLPASKAIIRGTLHGGLATAGVGAGLATVGAGRAVHHGYQQNKHTQAAQAARVQRNAGLAKADRKHVETGALAGGAAGAGVAAARSGRASSKFAERSVIDHDLARRMFTVGQQRTARHGLATATPGALPRTGREIGRTHGVLEMGRAKQASASDAAKASFRAARRAKGAAAAAGVLGAAAVASSRRSDSPKYQRHSYR